MKTRKIGKSLALIILCLLLVSAQTSAMAAIRVSSISLDRSTCTLYYTTLSKIPHAYQLKATIYPSNATNRTLRWTTSNSARAIVSSTGVVTVKGVGSVQIRATATDGSGKYAYCIFCIKPLSYAALVTYMITPECNRIYNALKSQFSSRSVGLSQLLVARGAITNLRSTCSKYSLLNTQSSRLSTMYTYCNAAYVRLYNNSNPKDSTLLTYIQNVMNYLKLFKTYCSSL